MPNFSLFIIKDLQKQRFRKVFNNEMPWLQD